MFRPDNNLPCNRCTEVAFHSIDEANSEGTLECELSKLAIRYTQDVLPYLTVTLPFRLPDDLDAGCSFLKACLEEGDSRWFSFEFTPDTGAITWRRNLMSTKPEGIDAELRKVRSFFDGHWVWIEDTAARCGAAMRPASPFSRFSSYIARFLEV